MIIKKGGVKMTFEEHIHIPLSKHNPAFYKTQRKMWKREKLLTEEFNFKKIKNIYAMFEPWRGW